MIKESKNIHNILPKYTKDKSYIQKENEIII